MLANATEIITPEIVDGHVFHQYTIRVPNGKRDALAQQLNDAGVGTMIYYPVPQDQLPVYRGQYPVLSVSELLAGEVISLPIWPEMESNVQVRIVEHIIKALSK